jgi:hypothetical protein
VGLTARLLEQLTYPHGDLAALEQAYALTGIEVERDRRRALHVVAEVERGVQLDAAEIHRPQQAGELVDDAVLDVGVLVAAPHRRGPSTPSG